MDDFCLMGQAATADELLPTLAVAAGVLIDVCVEHGMSPNLQRSKTEALVVLRGPGAVRVRRSAFADLDPSVEVVSRHWAGQSLRVVPWYRHLGGILHWSRGLDRELRSRTAQTWTSFAKYRAKIFCNAVVPLADKFPLLNSLILSVLFFGAGTWVGLTERHLARLEGTYLISAAPSSPSMCKAISFISAPPSCLLACRRPLSPPGSTFIVSAFWPLSFR